jgi:chromate transport protein ChrA
LLSILIFVGLLTLNIWVLLQFNKIEIDTDKDKDNFSKQKSIIQGLLITGMALSIIGILLSGYLSIARSGITHRVPLGILLGNILLAIVFNMVMYNYFREITPKDSKQDAYTSVSSFLFYGSFGYVVLLFLVLFLWMFKTTVVDKIDPTENLNRRQQELQQDFARQKAELAIKAKQTQEDYNKQMQDLRNRENQLNQQRGIQMRNL